MARTKQTVRKHSLKAFLIAHKIWELEKKLMEDEASKLGLSLPQYIEQHGGELKDEPQWDPYRDPHKDVPLTAAWCRIKLIEYQTSKLFLSVESY